MVEDEDVRKFREEWRWGLEERVVGEIERGCVGEGRYETI